MNLAAASIVALLMLQASAAASDASVRVTKPEWLRRPSGEELAAALSVRARAEDMSGWAVMKCHIAPKGVMRNCQAIASGPDGYDFGKTALKLASRFSVKPATTDGKPVDNGTILIPIVFSMPGTGLPKLSYAPGRPSYLLNPIATKGPRDTVIPCPSAADLGRVCKADQIYWKDTPPLEDTAPIILDAKQTSGSSVAYCKVTDGKISGGCQMEGERRPAALAAAGKTLAKLREPHLMNGDPITSGIVAVVYDWETLSEAAAAIVAAAD